MASGCIPEQWKQSGEAARSYGALSTDGFSVWSYLLEIGFTDDSGRKVVKDYTGRHFRSITTSKHIGMLKRVADLIVEP